MLPLLRKRELDLAVLVTNEIEDAPELHITKLNQHKGYFVVRSRHPLLASRDVLTLRSVLQFPVVMASRVPTSLLKQFLVGEMGKSTDHSTAKSFPTIACESVAMMKKIVAETDAVSILPFNVVLAEVRTGQLVVLPLVPPLKKVDFGIVRLAQRSLSPIGETFVRLLREVDAELLEFEEKNAPKIPATPKRVRSSMTS
jgi:DNA-binding transcriptional LysR family regulator